jgi:hypothetical protein
MSTRDVSGGDWEIICEMTLDVCEMRDGADWKRVDIEDALTRRGEDMRCTECHGGLKAFRSYNTGSRSHFEHSAMHTGCSTKSRTFNGRRSRHPLALD